MVGRWFCLRRDHSSSNTPTNKFNVRFFSYETLRIATNNFSTFIDRGAYGSVFKGVLDDDGSTVAIKLIHNPDHDRFLERVEFMSHFRHVNLVHLIGCCVENDKQLLVFKFTDNGSISQQLHFKKNPALNWERRSAVCIGIARGLSYLHEEIDQQVIHCDIKPANILLDANFLPKIADFDLIHLENIAFQFRGTSTVKGTPGYMDPNYISTRQLTEKVDVYTFGVTMLEIITGRRVVEMSCRDDRMILDWVTRVRKDGTVLKIVDPKLTDFPKEDVERFINVALLCTQANPQQRPSMFRIVHMLYGGHKSDMEISDMAIVAAVAAQPLRLFSGNSALTSSSSSSESMSSSSKASRSGDSSGKEEQQSCEEDIVRAYFERSMEKIMRFQAAVHSASNNRATTTTQASRRVSMEAVYPPFLSGEYSQRPSQF